nr:MAG TPA: hypothetical protein [Caudoviricetes sp.]
MNNIDIIGIGEINTTPMNNDASSTDKIAEIILISH